jgi:outer membrane protein
MTSRQIGGTLAFALTAGMWSAAAPAQEAEEPVRTRVTLGPQLVPKFPGSEEFEIRPFVGVSRARGTEEFEFEAPDESFGFSLLGSDKFGIGPAIGFEGKRTAKDVGAPLPEVNFTVEVGGFVQFKLADPFRVRAEVRKGLGGHKGWIGVLSADYIARDRDEWLFSIGPRLTFGDDRYHRSYFSVAPADSLASGLPAYSAGGGLQAVGGTAGFGTQFTPRWGLYTYGKYDRLVDDAGRSPIVRRLGSRDQFSAGVALTYTFGKGVRSR